MDDSINWSKDITAVKSKMSRYLGIMYKIKKFLHLAARLQIYHSFVQSHVNYCSFNFTALLTLLGCIQPMYVATLPLFFSVISAPYYFLGWGIYQ